VLFLCARPRATNHNVHTHHHQPSVIASFSTLATFVLPLGIRLESYGGGLRGRLQGIVREALALNAESDSVGVKNNNEDSVPRPPCAVDRGVCFAFQTGSCTRGESCKFAHRLRTDSEDEGKRDAGTGGAPTPKKPTKSKVCFAWQKGECQRGERCKFSHDGQSDDGNHNIDKSEAATAVGATAPGMAASDVRENGGGSRVTFSVQFTKDGHHRKVRHGCAALVFQHPHDAARFLSSVEELAPDARSYAGQPLSFSMSAGMMRVSQSDFWGTRNANPSLPCRPFISFLLFPHFLHVLFLSLASHGAVRITTFFIFHLHFGRKWGLTGAPPPLPPPAHPHRFIHIIYTCVCVCVCVYVYADYTCVHVFKFINK
jgi:hypothetical protein